MGVTAQGVTDRGLEGQAEPAVPKAAKPPLPSHAHIVWRGAALLLALMTAYLWWTRNFGAGLEGVPIVAALVAAFTFAFGIFGEGEQKWVKKRFFHFLLSAAFLVPVYVGEAVALFSTAPVVVLNSTDEPLTASLYPADAPGQSGKPQSSEKAAPLRMHIWSTTPLGRPYIIKVPGYAP